MDIVIWLEVPATHEAAGAADRRLVERIEELEAALQDAQREHESASDALGAFCNPGGTLAEGIEALRQEMTGRLAYAFRSGFRWRSQLGSDGVALRNEDIEERAKAFAEGKWTP